jgi:uncharacterized repeat protein (TIGR02543 family)
MRKPIALLVAGSMTLMPLLGSASVVLTPVSEAYAASDNSTVSDYPEGVKAYLDGTRLASFDPSGSGEVYDATGRTVRLSGVPDDWTVQWRSAFNEITNKNSIMYILSNGSTTYRYWFDGADGAVHTVEELHGMTITLNGQAVDGDITQGFTIHDVTAGDMKGYENAPSGWVLDGDSEDDHYTYTAHPEDSDTPSVQYTFLYDDTRPHDSINSLRNLKAYLTVDGSAVKGFDYTLANTDTLAIPMNTDVRLEGVPDGWKVDYNNPSTGKLNRVYTLTGPCGDTFTYIFHPTSDYEGYYYIDQLQYVRAFADGELVDGFDYRGGAWSFPETTKNVEIANVPDDWNTQRSVDGNTITYVVSSPNNSVSVTYVFNIAKHQASLDELSNVKAIVGGNYVSGFNPKQSGIYEYEDGQGIAIVNVPSGWTQTTTDGDGYKVYTLTSGDLSVSYRFNKHVKTYSVDELAKVSASTDDGVVQDFKPMESGTYTIGEHATVWITGVPDGWDTESSDNDMTYTVTSPDGKIKVVYTFKHAKHKYSASELKNVTAKLPNGDYLNGFDPVSGGEFTVPMGTKNVTIGHIPNGWNLTKNNGLSYTLTSSDGEVSVSYKFHAKNGHTVVFDTDGGTTVESQTVEDGGTITQPDDYPSKTGYRFKGWYKDGVPYDFTQPVYDDAVITAKWTVNTYEVYFDAGASDDWYPMQTIAYGDKVVKPVDPTLDGYDFDGWLLDGKEYSFDTPVTADMTLTASWKTAQVQTHTVTFTGAEDDFTQTVADGSSATVPTVPSKKGYTFDGWYSGDSLYDFTTPVTKDVTLKAKWEKTKVESYTVAFDSADGSEVASQTVEQGKTAVKPDDPTREGYTFLGWYAGDAAYDWDTPVTGNLILTAHWQKNEQPQPKTYTVTFDYQNGSPSDARTVSEGNTVTPPENPVRDGYDFQGWVGIDGSEFDFEQPITSDTLVSAKWKKHEDPKPVMHTVTFNSNGGTSIDPQTVQDGLTVRRPANPVKNDYVFDGWYLDNDQYDFNKPVTGDITLTAIYHRKPIPQPNTYTVRFDTGEGSKVDPQTIIEGKTVIRPADPSMDGYDFQGWLLDGKDYDWNTPITGDMTLTASWKKHEEPKPVTHTVSFYTDGGSMVAQQTVNDGETVTVPDTPTKNGYTFSGWTLNGEPYDFNLPVTADITLKATWVENQKPQPKRHTVTFDTTGGSEIGQQTVDEGEKAIQPANPTREGYDFQGWLLNGQAYDWDTPITGDITLTASWTEKAPTLFTVAFNTGGASNIPSQKVKEGDKAARPTDPKRTGYTFTGWQLNGKDYDWNIPITTDIILTATWQKNETPKPVFYTVKFDTGNGSKIDLQTIQQGGKVKKPADPTLNGYKFVGWQLDGKDYDFNTAVSKDMTLTAMWEANTLPPTAKKHTVTVTLYDGKTERYEVKDGEKLTLPSNPTRDGYVFDGFIDKDGNVYDISKPVVKDLTLTCVWKKANGVSSDKDKEIADASTNGTVGNGEQNSDSQNPLASTGAPIYGMVIAAIIAGLGGIGILLARLRSRDD